MARPKRQDIDGTGADGQALAAASGRVGGQKATPDVDEQGSLERARQRLARDLGQGSENAPRTTQQARALIAELGTRLAADPKTGLAAHGEVSPDLYSAATAQPNG